MTGERKGLGKNLSALLGTIESNLPQIKDRRDFLNLPIGDICPGKYQPRTLLSDSGLNELTESIKQQGLLQPLIVRQLSASRYEILAGERRWRACQLAGLAEVPVILRQVDDETASAIALVENLQREDLSVMDQARAMKRLMDDFNLTHQQIAQVLSKSRAAVSNYIRLLQLPDEVKAYLDLGQLDLGHARALLGLEQAQQVMAAKWVIAKALSVRETEKLVMKWKTSAPESHDLSSVASSSLLFSKEIERLADQLQTKVKLKHHQTGKGCLMIHYASTTELDQVFKALEWVCIEETPA